MNPLLAIATGALQGRQDAAERQHRQQQQDADRQRGDLLFQQQQAEHAQREAERAAHAAANRAAYQRVYGAGAAADAYDPTADYVSAGQQRDAQDDMERALVGTGRYTADEARLYARHRVDSRAAEAKVQLAQANATKARTAAAAPPGSAVAAGRLALERQKFTDKTGEREEREKKDNARSQAEEWAMNGADAAQITDALKVHVGLTPGEQAAIANAAVLAAQKRKADLGAKARVGQPRAASGSGALAAARAAVATGAATDTTKATAPGGGAAGAKGAPPEALIDQLLDQYKGDVDKVEAELRRRGYR